MKTTNAEKDLALVKAMKSDNSKEVNSALETLYNKYHDLIFYRYKKMVKSDVDAEDLAVEAFTKCYENINQFNEKNAFSTWLFSLTRNLFIDKLRKRKTETISIGDMVISDDEGHSTEREFEAPYLNPEEVLREKERNEHLQNIIETTFKSKPHFKELIELRYFHNMSYNDIQKTVGLPLNTVKAHLFRAKAMLRDTCTQVKLDFKI